MTRLSTEKILQEKQTRDPNTISTLALNHKALSDVSCLAHFKNLERLDLGFNNLSSLEGLKSCINLKWLSVLQNKLQSLKGIEGLTKLTVLNAGKNKLRSMDEIRSLVSLRALILNDNEIVSICKLDQVKNLNTLVLSRNPVRKIGDSLVKVKSITKLSLSKCELQSIDSSLKSCIELKELRLAHNDIKTIPAELAHNIRLQNLDLGNNCITSWSDLKVLHSLVNLKNLNLQGNPIAEKDKLAKKVKNLIPNLQIFNARPVDKNIKNGKSDRVDDSLLNVANELEVQEEKRDHGRAKKNTNHHVKSHSEDGYLGNSTNIDVEKKLGREKKNKKNDGLSKDFDVEMKSRQKKQKTNEELLNEVSVQKDDSIIRKDSTRKSKKAVRDELDVIDDGETPFMEIFAADSSENPKYSGEMKTSDNNLISSLVTFPAKRKKTKSQGMGPAALQSLSPAVEVGMGGSSTWDDV
ncbi:hypothetical protein L1049_013950 [Liquidambar formosana]|uniref:Protein phosphatase 1 regulatory subunit 7 n=1 Tax=Liquidambar formosana TaxID=63359 RepID=A0AAP0RPN8_LIQFO